MRNGVLFFIVLALFLSVSASLAETMLSAIDARYKTGQISLDEAMLYKAYAVFNHKLLPADLQSLTPPRCGTPVIVEIKQHWEELSQNTRNALSRMLTRPSGLPETYNTTHFKLHYTLSGGDAVPNEAYVITMGTKFEDAYDFIVSTRGYFSPPSDGTAGGDSRYDVYIYALSAGVLGYTSPEVGGPQPWNDATSYIAMRNSYTAYGPTTEMIEITSIHEYFHAVQFAYDATEQPWYMEVSSVWIEDEKYPTYDYEHYYLSDFFSNPDISITTYNGSHEYGSYHWNTYLSETFGDSVVKMIWEENRYSSATTSFQSVLAGFGSGRSSAFAQFFAWNYFTGTRNLPGLYPEGTDYPLIHIERTHTTYPASGTPTNQPENLASNYIVFNVPSGASGPFSVTFDGEDGRSWWAQVILYDATSYTTHQITLNSYGYGYITIDSTEWAGHSTILLVVGNVSTSGGAATYSYHADFETVGPSYNPPRNLVAESGHSGTVPLTWDPPIGGGTGGTEELSYDDGTGVGYIPWDLTGSGFGHLDYEGVKFNAAVDCTLKQIKVYFYGTEASVQFHIAPDDGGIPGTDYSGSPFSATVTPGAWQTIDVPGGGIPIAAGYFWVGYTRTGDDIMCLLDAEETTGDPSLAHDDLDNWLIPGGDYLIRAEIAAGSSGPTVTGYRVHRGTSPGGPYSFIGTASTESYDDGSVTDGTSYYYVVSATYSDAGESGYSNEAMAVPGTGSGTGGDTLRHDDGDAEYILTGTSLGDEYAVVFEPTGPCQLIALRYFASGTPYTSWFGVGLHRWTGTRISGNYIDPFPYWIDPDPNGWTEIDMTPYDIYLPGDFAAGFIVMDTSVHIGIDDVDDDYSWVYDAESDNWYDLSYTLFIQAVVRYLDTTETHSLYGVVELSSGSGGSPPPSDLSGSIVRIIETGALDTTDTGGHYQIDSLPAGVYTVEAWHPGYESQQITVGISDNTELNFSLIAYNTPLNPVRNLTATSYLDGEVLLRWLPPFGFPGTAQEIYYYDPYAATLWYASGLSAGDIFDTRFEISFPCTLTTVAVMCYDSTDGYPNYSIHFLPDDGEGYPEIGNDLVDSVVVSPNGYPYWDTVNVSDRELVLWPGQIIHIAVRLLSSQPSVLKTDSIPHYDPPISRYYSHSAGTWYSDGEQMISIIVKYFAGEARLSATTPVVNQKLLGWHSSSEEVAPNRRLPEAMFRRVLSPLEPEGLQQYIIYRSDSPTGPFSIAGTVEEPETLYYIDDDATNGELQYYCVVASYDHGYSDASDTAVALPLAFNDTAWVLLVDDDASCYNSIYPDDGIPLAQILLDLGVPFNAVDLDPLYYIPTDALDDYQAVIWSCGAVYANSWTLADSEETNLAAYLDGGGKFALFAQDYLWDRFGSASTFSPGTFAHDYLGVSGANQDEWTIYGDTAGTFTGYGFADGLSYNITNPFSNWQLYVDNFTTFSGDTLLALNSGGADGIVGTQFDGPGFRTVFLATTPFAMVDGTTPNTVEEFIRRMLFDYFNVHAPAAAETVVASYELSAGWHILSVPVQLEDNSAASVFPGNIGVFRYNPATMEYVPVTTVEPGIGYFVLFVADADFDLVGLPIDTISVSLGAGWNIIGVPWNPTGSLSFDEAVYTPDMLIPSTYFGFNPGTGAYFIPTEAEITKGYWVAVMGDCELQFPGDTTTMKFTAFSSHKAISSSPPPPPFDMIPDILVMTAPHPNPFNSFCKTEILLPKPSTVRMIVSDVTGRSIISEKFQLTTGRHSLSWDGKDAVGADAPSGIYFITIKSDNVSTTRSVLLVR